MPKLDPEQRMVIVTTVDALKRQAQKAMDDIKAANGGVDPPNVRDAYDIDPVAFAKLIEAMYNLAPVTGLMPDEELRQLAGLKPIDQVI